MSPEDYGRLWTRDLPQPLAQAYLLAGYTLAEATRLHTQHEDVPTETLQMMASLAGFPTREQTVYFAVQRTTVFAAR